MLHEPHLPGVYGIRGPLGCLHFLVDDRRRVTLLDTGLWGETPRLLRALRHLGLGLEAVDAILLTHGHLDHAGNLAWARAATGAPIYAHAAEQAHIDGTFAYTGVSRWCGRLERCGRAVLRVGRPVAIDVQVQDGDELPFWGGLQVVHLPGHTAGHCGFYSARHRVLFSGDLFASYFFDVHLPPAILNSVPAALPASLARVRTLDPLGLIPQHYDRLDASLHRRRFDRLCQRRLATG